MIKVGIIYKISNLINDKIYIGQTRYEESKKELGAVMRWKQHTYCARTNANKSVALEAAIRKYGKDGFSVETIKYCQLDELNNFEIEYIKKFKSTDPKYGYNISSGGAGSSIPMTEEKRKNISLGQSPKIEIPGIIEKYRDGKLVGYRAQRKQNGKKYEKLFSDQNKTLKDNFNLALQYIDNVKTGKLLNYNSFNRKDNLPKNIYKEFDNYENHIGYRFQIILNKKQYVCVFTNKKLSLEEKFCNINIVKEKWDKLVMGKNNAKNISDNECKYIGVRIQKPKIHDLPKNIKREYSNGKVVGFRFQIVINKKRHTKVFKHSGQSMDEKLEKAINAKEKFLKQLSNN